MGYKIAIKRQHLVYVVFGFRQRTSCSYCKKKCVLPVLKSCFVDKFDVLAYHGLKFPTKTTYYCFDDIVP